MSADASPPQGYETKSTPGYTPAAVPSADHPGPEFEGTAGYSNSPGITDEPEKSSEAPAAEEQETTKAPAKSESAKGSTKSGTSKS